ncbi:MAG: phenylacetate--CoA ligase [Deltaproteobacteria bacterium]|nr:phenylacetate--CoA ligase [Deltaproteobacteria bacterium]MBW2047619.1 phenylacetate--CoA ligase [Deltaproteobacteria bacterium]MBW2110630.1 phenylacetate--CoA ligase [Deltaproteobacteria bacterium]MBW2351966.1 phenylacetate--CoA ligase [Deltaproteobacteria bacterium]HDZ89740.1 phenylacetate--CoA ligase family protein [Deltaproteobacteria bacterium]
MPRTFMPEIKTNEELKQVQLEGLKWTVNHAYAGSTAYRKKLDEAGVKPGDILSLDDLRKLPFTTSSDLQEGYPFPLLSVPFDQVVRIHASSGTTGKRKVLCYTEKDIDDWTHFFARCYEMAGLIPEDRVQIAVGYGVWTAGISFQMGCEAFGAMAVPAGPGNMDMQCQFLIDFQSTVMCCTASMGLLLAEEVNRRGIRDRINLKKMIFGSERSSDAMRKRIGELLGLEHMFDIPGMTELYGPGTGLDCTFHQGIHYWADYYILEILDPDTLEPVPEGRTGEMVVTTLKKEGVPLIRYRTRDLTRMIPGECPCGSILPRHDRILGRSDDMIIFRAVNIYPGQVDHVLSGIEGIGSEYQIVLERGEDGRDYMMLRVEQEQGIDRESARALSSTIAGEIKKQIMVSARVELVEYGSLPRSERKSRRVFDNRDNS